MTDSDNKQQRDQESPDEIIATQNQIIQSLRETNKELMQRIDFLKDQAEEYKQLRQMFAANPYMTWSQAYQVVIQRQNALQQAYAQQRNYQKQQEQETAEAARQAELEKQVLKERPDILREYGKAKSDIAKEKTEFIAKAKKFFAMRLDEFRDYQSVKHDVSESPVQDAIVFDESKPGGYICKVDNSSYFTLSQVEEHIYASDVHNEAGHKQFVIDAIESGARQALGRATAEYMNEIQEAAIRIASREQNEDYKKRMPEQ